MNKESYSIDDILSEVKQHKAEQDEKAMTMSSLDDSSNDESKDSEGDLVDNIDDGEDTAQDDSDLVFTEKEQGVGENQTEQASFDEQDEPQTDETDDTVVFKNIDEVGVNPTQKSVQSTDDGEFTFDGEESKDEQSEETQSDGVVADNQDDADSNGMVDLLTLAQKEDEPIEETQEKVKFFKTKKGKICKVIIIVLVILIVAAAVLGVLYVNGALNKVTSNDDAEPYEKVDYYDGMDFLQEDFPSIEEVDASQITDYKQYLKDWYYNGDPVSSTHVLNVLLIGEDTRSETISDTSRADSAIIASVNIDTGEINLTSILRDLYVYFEVDGVGQYGKINAAASLGGITTYITTVERYYKISIDNYVVVNFSSFESIINALDGVDISITSAEISEINNHPSRYNNVTITQTFTGTEGVMTLNGEQAVAYCRIRKIDSDGARADRQKAVLEALFEKASSSGTVDIVKTVNSLIDYVYTGFSKKELIEIGNTALKDGWLNYEIQTQNVPSSEDGNAKGGNFKTSSGSYRYGAWIWKSDIPEDAYNLQMKIYGKSNIVLNENRADYINID